MTKKISVTKILAPLKRKILENKSGLIPAVSFKKMGHKYNNSQQWLHFAQNICQSGYMRKHAKRKGFFSDRAGLLKVHICLWCGARINNDNFQVHHSSYDHVCQHAPSLSKSIPDCESCRKDTPDNFKKCLKLLHPVHSVCNLQISNPEKAEKYKDQYNNDQYIRGLLEEDISCLPDDAL